ncbi:hypothetical protein [Streptomyces sp. VRA16 Mangrove soil]|uniref:hypothetical protein n=1 Tax=Streptomyces sp. VRA16 Mangrove soil TaxID=2817434 RepID=UPI001A9E77DE|nr:hypothetical protein [Streptomyces sp. VRA16 Mangrove soil]MBO1329987.1 hypothetical protein [Streptomyces sp. VRA16 Mangrove soil]
MRGSRRASHPRAAAPVLAEHLRSVLWGPAEFVGVPRRLLVEGLLAGGAAAALTVGAGFAGMWGGPRELTTGEPGLLVIAVLVLYLLIRRAGRILVGLVAVLGICLALMSSDVAAGVALQQRGLVEPARVASVQPDSGRGRALCAVTGVDAVPTGAAVWRGCGATTALGDTLPVVYDPEGRAPTRGVAAPGELRAAQLRLAALATAFLTGCACAVARSFRMTAAPRAD